MTDAEPSPNQDALVSVILCLYNAGPYLAATIESVLAQSYRNLELIIVDDGSTDDSVNVVRRFLADSRVRLLQQKNGGTASALATGLDAASGEFLAFMDQDDLWTSDKLAVHVEWMRQRPEIELTFSWFEYIDSEGKPIGIRSSRVRGRFGFQDVVREYMIGATSNVVARREAILRAGGVDRSIPRLYDLDVFLRIARLSKQPNLEAIPRDLMHYRRHAIQITRDFSSLEQEWEQVIEKMRRVSPDQVTPVLSEGRSHNCRFLARLAYERHSYRQALGYVWRGFRNSPVKFVLDFRNWLTAAACLSGALLPTSLHRRLELAAGLRRP